MIGEPLYDSEDEKLALVERNVYLQSNRIAEIAPTLGRSLNVTSELIRELHRLAIQDIYSDAGQFRDCPVKIIESSHVPPDSDFVPGLIQSMCDEVNADDPDNESLISTASFLLWRLNWIHPADVRAEPLRYSKRRGCPRNTSPMLSAPAARGSFA
jgi:fido (protein-threonine AMPylation protein)